MAKSKAQKHIYFTAVVTKYYEFQDINVTCK